MVRKWHQTKFLVMAEACLSRVDKIYHQSTILPCLQNTISQFAPMAVDLKVSRIRRHLEENPSFGGQTAGAGVTADS